MSEGLPPQEKGYSYLDGAFCALTVERFDLPTNLNDVSIIPGCPGDALK